MAAYTSYLRGSEWNKWDLHVHTPASIYHRFGPNTDDTWEAYIKDLETLPQEFAVLGINDYFFIDGYERLQKEKETNGRLKNIKTLLPVIEFRIEKFAGVNFGQLKRINLHVIFSDKVSVETIKSQFLNTLEQSYSLESGRDWTRAITKESVEELGKEIKKGIPADQLHKYDNDLKEGFNNLNVKEEKIFDALKKDCFEGQYLIAIGKTEWGELKWTDASIATKKSIINKADIVFTAACSIDDFDKAKGQLTSQSVNNLLLDCSDAHYLSTAIDKDRIGNCLTWIKAEPTFEGLKSIIYEPESRIKVQAIKPDNKNERHVISELLLSDANNIFGQQQIYLSENLNAIIGGKSSGKSLLLYSIAQSIDPEQVYKTSKKLQFEGYKFDAGYEFKVKWKNGDIDVLSNRTPSDKHHKITYIPQLYINYLVEKNNKEELNSLIQSILFQDTGFKNFYENVIDNIRSATAEIERLLTTYLQVRTKIINLTSSAKEIGQSNIIQKAISQIEGEITKGQQASNFLPEEIEAYKKLLDEKAELEKLDRLLIQKEGVLAGILKQFLKSKEELFGNPDAMLKGQIDLLLGEMPVEDNELTAIKTTAESDFEILIQKLQSSITAIDIKAKQAEISIKMKGNANSMEPFLKKLADQQELQKLVNSLNSEKEKLQKAIANENQRKQLMLEYGNLRKQTAVLMQQRYDLYKTIQGKINATKKDVGSGIELKCELKFHQYDLPLFDQVNKAALNNDHKFYSFFDDGQVNYDNIIELYGHQLAVAEDKLYYDNDKTKFIPLKVRTSLEDVLRGLLKNCFELDYSVQYKGDDLLSMSPGKKGTVLLILFLQISSSEFPILIDQPEDNLDNRTIYELLCTIIRERKKDRQIIIVSHNANLVVSTDAENIIVANQKGQNGEDEQNRSRFEYVNGALEYSFKNKNPNNDILKSQGIREHVCDVLEGGGEAFKQRERKYSIKL